MSQNGWKLFKPQTGGGRNGLAEMYKNRLVIVIGESQYKHVYLSQLVMDTLKSDYVEVYTRGSNIAFFPGEAGATSYKITRHNKASNGSPYLTLSALGKKWNIQPGVYECHIEDGGVVFDTQQKPSKV